MFKHLTLSEGISTGAPSSPPWDGYIYLYSILPVSAIVVVAVLVIWAQRQYYKKNFLTQMEVNQFYKASAISNSDGMELANSATPNSDYVKFPCNYEILAGDIELEEEVDRGKFGVVHLGVLKKREQVAVKIPREDCRKEEFLSALSELKILSYVGSHPNIVSFIGSNTKNIHCGSLMIVIEFCGKGSLEGYIRSLDADGGTYLDRLHDFAYQIAAGMEHLAEKRIIHGDLATRNVLLSVNYTSKISDFRLSRKLYEANVYVKRGNEAMPWMWMAPESLRNREFTTKSDVWSYAVTLWEMFSMGQLPYPGKWFTDGFIRELESEIRLEKAKFASEEIHGKILEC